MAPYTIRIAGRMCDDVEPPIPFVYGATTACGSGEPSFPLRVPPRTRLRADAANSEMDAEGNLVPVIIGGPAYAGAATPNTIEFTAGDDAGGSGDVFTSEGGLDGSEIRPYGIVIAGGACNVNIRADRKLPLQWPPAPAPPSAPTMSIRLEKVHFAGEGMYDLDAHIEDGGVGDFEVLNCRFTTDRSFGSPFPPGLNHTNQTLVHVLSTEMLAQGIPVLNPKFTGNTITVVPGPLGLPDLSWGMVIEPFSGSDSYVRVDSLMVDGAATAGSPTGGIAMGLEYASNTTNPVVGGANLIPRFDLTASTIQRCSTFGAGIATGTAQANLATVTRIEIAGNVFTGNGVRPSAFVQSSSTHGHYRGSGLHLVCRHEDSWFIGSISTNQVVGNVTGIGVTWGSLDPPAWLLGLGAPQGLTIAGNVVKGQMYFPAGYCPLDDTYSDGVGIVLGDDYPANGNGPGTYDARFVLERNEITGNARHGVAIARGSIAALGGAMSPVLRNDRIYANGTSPDPAVAPCPPQGPGPYGDGVRIYYRPGSSGVLAPTLVHGTVVANLNGFGVNNVGGASVLWNSIVYDNNVAITAPGVPKDLSGLVFPAPPGLPVGAPGTVNFTDFCGSPWGTAAACGSGPPTGPIGGCISSPPVFIPPDVPNLQLTCGTTGAPCPGGCAATCASPCIDAADAVGPGPPFMPTLDANGVDRAVSLNQPCPATDRPDMGAMEKQTCTP